MIVIEVLSILHKWSAVPDWITDLAKSIIRLNLLRIRWARCNALIGREIQEVSILAFCTILRTVSDRTECAIQIGASATSLRVNEIPCCTFEGA